VSDLRDQVLAALAQFQPTALDIGGVPVYVRPITVTGMARVHAAQAKHPEDVPLLLILDCVVDERGTRIFSDVDRPQLEQMPGQIAEKILSAIETVSAMRAKSAEAATGN
jgi:hypothetical protein